MIPGLSAKEDVHPISRLMAEAETRYRNKLAAQSATIPALAVAEYRQRYGHAPPKGFDAWYSHTRSVNFVMVDEVDGLNEGVDVVWVEDGEMHVVDKRELREDEDYNNEWLDSVFHVVLPYMDFSINAKAEGRVVVAWEALQSNSSVAGNSSDTQPLPRHPDWRGTGSVWEAWRRTCAPASPARAAGTARAVDATFITRLHTNAILVVTLCCPPRHAPLAPRSLPAVLFALTSPPSR
ncbi:hypothetical protein C8J57DRAFT_1504828 [Mycena rebaudengoi]|nr:hypothetical protein C8J57DRAFT_1504828 [Mycena rebaudengoi]